MKLEQQVQCHCKVDTTDFGGYVHSPEQKMLVLWEVTKSNEVSTDD
jgi:hypothetical protein